MPCQAEIESASQKGTRQVLVACLTLAVLKHLTEHSMVIACGKYLHMTLTYYKGV